MQSRDTFKKKNLYSDINILLILLILALLTIMTYPLLSTVFTSLSTLDQQTL